MKTSEIVQILTWIPYIAVFLAVADRALRRPVRANVDMTLFFGVIAVDILLQVLSQTVPQPPSPLLTLVLTTLAMALPYLLLRLVDDFSDIPRWLLHLAEAGLVLIAISQFLELGRTLPLPWVVFYVAYFTGLVVYASVRFVREAGRTHGVTRRRMQAAAAGSFFLGLAVLVAGLQALAPRIAGLWNSLTPGFALASGLSYFLGFAPPSWLRHAWQEPELRAFLSRAAYLPRLPSTSEIVRELQTGAASIVGAPQATIGLWDPETRVLRYHGDQPGEFGPREFIAGRAFTRGRTVFSDDAARDDPEHAELYRQSGATAILAAPIAAGRTRLGVLAVSASRAPIFADDDLELVQLLANQAAVILESRALIDEAARVRAREETTRLKDDFLSSAAHDLKTPLTTLVAQAQLLERRALLRPDAPMDVAGLQRLVRESNRLNRLVLELLDASRLEQRSLIIKREPVDLVQVAAEAAEDQSTERHRCVVRAEGPVIGCFDRIRMKQLIENLLENGVKYTPGGGEIVTAVWIEGQEARLSVTDPGIGIPESDLPQIFSRYHRGTNVDDRRFAGMGLGLFTCRNIVEQHGGRIWATSKPGEGSAFHVALPLPEGGAPCE